MLPEILVLDDDASILQFLKDALFNRYHVYTAAGILEATDLISTHLFDLIICDLNMPIVSGIELIKHIRAFPRFDRTPILVISAYPEMTEKLEGLYVEAFLPKPFSVAKLQMVIDGILQHTQPGPDAGLISSQ